MEKPEVAINPQLCRQCSSCELRCSLAYAGVFNPAKARIVVKPGKISFNDDCVKGCHLCVRYCVYGALTQK